MIDKEIIKKFWTEKSKEKSNRWSGNTILEYERNLLAPYAKRANKVIDLGCGHGELSRSIVDRHTYLLGVDYIPDYANSFDKPNQSFVCSSLTDYKPFNVFDLALLLGVVTYLDLEEENSIYCLLSKCISTTGLVVVKNQCSNEKEFVFNGYSKFLKTSYSARYPEYDTQINRLSYWFNNINAVKYPEEFNTWKNTFHVAFFCSNKS
ncbi:class I SAM-dependent methyltransferase [Methylicorpusculum oleiharenae]|uniref:class I SAM-dependent methyltransferase n=1 Tax=Methylicorpusculum oleiharenae TaxID=1338687 RepID=UPI001356C084|nr:class I SAM-dependent methyltransferase [Methylicorpusculum oleiharenae]MCD2452743.1 class I SAM-dependent methyltransferase [Methylicorpusculum oleiharenae]